MPEPQTLRHVKQGISRESATRVIEEVCRRTGTSPLIRNRYITDKVLGVSEKTIRKIAHELAVNAKISKKLPDSWMYSVRTHSLRKYFRTQMSTAKIDTEIIHYMMGHTIDTYEDVQSLGIETLRSLYIAAGLAIRPKTQVNKIGQHKKLSALGEENLKKSYPKTRYSEVTSPERQDETQNHQLLILAENLKQIIRKETTE